jgi:Uma2 family endonuclease
MPTELPRPLLRFTYEEAAQQYLRSLPLEHFMEATAQATQREITVESLALVKAQRRDLHYFNELLVQYPFGRTQKIRQVVPDNMVVKWDGSIDAVSSYNIPLQPVGPLWVMEYVSNSNKRKDYGESFLKYERELKVPYYLLFYPDNQELTLFRLKGKRYVSVRANASGRHPVPDLEMEVAIQESWVRYWYQGRLLLLPAEMEQELVQARRQLSEAREKVQQANEQTRLAHEQVQLARDEVQQAREQAERELRDKERLIAQLRALGIEPQ